MTDFFPQGPSAILYDGNDAPVPGVSIESVVMEVGKGWSFQGWLAGEWDLWEARDTPYRIELSDGLGGSQDTPHFCIPQRSFVEVYSTVAGANISPLDGEDVASFRMRKPNQNFSSFIATSSGALVAELATRADVTITDVPDFYVSEEEVKAAKLDQALQRILAVSANESYVRPDNQIVCVPWEAAAGNLVFPCSSIVPNVDTANIFTGQRLGKSTSIPLSGNQYFDFDEDGFFTRSLTVPLLLASPSDGGTETGSIGAVTTWNGDPGAGGEWLTHWDATNGNYPEPVTPQGTGAATHITVTVLPAAGPFFGLPVAVRVRVQGVPENEDPPGVDREFLYPPVISPIDTSLGDWPAPDFIDSLFQSQAYAITRRAYILAKLNSAAATVRLTGPFRCGVGVQPFLRYTYRTKTYKVARIEWNLGTRQTTVTCVRTWEN